MTDEQVIHIEDMDLLSRPSKSIFGKLYWVVHVHESKIH